MKYNILGGTELRVSQLGFGCGNIGWGRSYAS